MRYNLNRIRVFLKKIYNLLKIINLILGRSKNMNVHGFFFKNSHSFFIGKVADRKKNPLDILHLSSSSTEQQPIEIEKELKKPTRLPTLQTTKFGY